MRGLVAISLVMVLTTTVVSAELSSRELRRIDEAAAVLRDMHAMPDQDVPSDLWEQASCVLVIPGLKKAATTDRRGRVGIAVQPPRAGIVTIRMANQPARCSTRRIGVVGVFQPPPVTG